MKHPALVIAHPGHELRVFGWLTVAQPRVHVLTDGSGSGGASRVASTAALLEQFDCERGSIFPAAPDRDVYAALTAGDLPWFGMLAERLAAALIRECNDCVVADAAEGFNPVHDVCRALVDAAVKIAARQTGRYISNWEFGLTEWTGEDWHGPDCRHIELTEDQLAKKLTASRGYAGLELEIETALKERGEAYFRRECVRPAKPHSPPSCIPKPYYETVGEQRVAAGHYQSVLRYSDHVFPVLQLLHNMQ